MDKELLVGADKLRAAFDLLLRHVVEQHGEQIRIQKDYFWSVPAPAVYDVTASPAELTIGQITEEWEHLEAMLVDNSKVLGYGLIWLADILRAIGHETVA